MTDSIDVREKTMKRCKYLFADWCHNPELLKMNEHQELCSCYHHQDECHYFQEVIDVREKTIQELLELNTMLARNHLLLEWDFIECLDLLFEMTYQACAVHPFGVEDCLDSMALRTNVDAMKYLANHGKLKITKEVGRRVFATVEDKL